MRFFLFIWFVFLSFVGEINAGSLLDDSIPKGAIRFSDFKNNVILDGILNDSVPMKALLDIGAWGIAVPSAMNPDERKYVTFEISGLKKRIPSTVMDESSQFLNWYGGHCVLLGWDFFNRRILEISYKKKYIRMIKTVELDSLKAGYDSIPFTNRRNRLLVDGTVCVQGKAIAGSFWIDTGLNGLLFLTDNVPSDYGLIIDKNRKGRAKNMDSSLTGINVLNADSIRIGNSLLTAKDILLPDSGWFVFKKNDLYIGLLGNQFFKNFSVIFDFRRSVLYLKAY